MITLLLLTHRNPNYIKRALLFYKKYIPEAQIIIADSNSDDKKNVSKACVKKVSTQEYAPLHLEFSSDTPYLEKVLNALTFAYFPYCLFVSDDDFFSPQCMREAVAFLEKNLEYTFVYGHGYGFLFDGIEPTWYFSGYYEDPRSFCQNNPVERVRSFAEKYAMLFYSVVRTDEIKTIFKDLMIYAPEWVFLDNLFSMLLLAKGKGRFLRKPFIFKEMSSLSNSDTLGPSWFLGRGFENNRKKMEEGLTIYLARDATLNDQEAEKISRAIIDTFMETTFDSMFPAECTFSFLQRQKNKLKRNLPESLKNRIISVRNALWNVTSDEGQSYLIDQNSPYAAEFQEVNRLIKESGILAVRDGFQDAWRLTL